jgi:hypothetical protein
LWLFSSKKGLMKRIFLFIVSNLAVLVLLGLVIFIIEHVFGVRLGQGGVGGLLVFAAICGFGGALTSLAHRPAARHAAAPSGSGLGP